MSLVFAAIAPHGGLAIAEACKPEERELAASTRRAFEELGRRSATARPDTVVVLTPHNVHVEGSMAVVVAGSLEGRLERTPVELRASCDRELATAIRAELRAAGLPAIGISFGGNDVATAVHPMDWAVLIPLWFLGGRADPPVRVVAISPARELTPAQQVAAGRAIAAAAERSAARVALVASADHGHGHSEAGPYGYSAQSAPYDRLVVELVGGNRLRELLDFDPAWVAAATADSWWQMLVLHGALGESWEGELLSYEAPTYFGMLCAAYRPAVPN